MTVTVVKRDGSQDHLSDDAVNELRTKLRGQLVVSDDPEARTEPREVWNAMHVDRPAITARCAGTADVVDVVNFARERGLLVAGRWCPIAHSRQPSCSRTTQQRCFTGC
ncbi:MAG: hypothetical protein WBV74_03430 [Pseudonocardiaceae bacterium]